MKMPKAMIVTVGTGTKNVKDLAHGIAFSIKRQNPDFVCFVVTEKSKQETIPYILDELALDGNQYEFKEIQDENDVEIIYQQCQEFIKQLPYKPQDIIADYTSGTKPMSAGLCMAAVSLEISSLSYVHGRREQGVTISGTERLMVLEPVRIITDAKIRMIIALFNNYQFDSCLSIIHELKEKTKEPDVHEKLLFLEILSLAYSYWEKFDIEKALNELLKLKDSKLLSQFGIKSKIEHNKEALYQENNDNYSAMKIADLLANATRRAEEGKYDDAVARLYRLLEFLAQYKLFKNYNGIDTANLDLNKLPSDNLKEKYQKLKKENGKIELALYKAYELLSDLDDAIGKRFVQNKDIKQVLGMRNKSILAHGFSPINKEGYEKVLELVSSYTDDVVSDIERLKIKVIFPKLKY
jgi:CRISPR-associated protein (TIGR02710 family)